MTSRISGLDQALDIVGSRSPSQSLLLDNEFSKLGLAVAGQTGVVANIVVGAPVGQARITGLTGMVIASIGQFLTISGAASVSNNGTFLIAAFNSAASVDIVNAAAVIPDANNGAITWTERNPYSLEDDINFVRTDRKGIKGTTNWYEAVPTYQRPTAVGTNVPANLTNIASKTTDAKALVENRLFLGATTVAGTLFTTIISAGNLKHANAVDRSGVPINDGADVGNDIGTYVEIIDPVNEAALDVIAGPDAGKRIYGRTRAGASVSPNSVEIEFRAVAKGASLGTSVPYTWEAGQPTTIDATYGFRQRVDQLDENALRRILASGIIGDSSLSALEIDLLLVIEPPKPSTNYDVTRVAGKVTQERWKRAVGLTDLKIIEYTYVGILVTLEVRKVYATDGVTVTARLDITYTYSGVNVVSATYVRVI